VLGSALARERNVNMRVVIHLEGGEVRGVYADDPTCDLVILDQDEMLADHNISLEGFYEALRQHTEGLVRHYDSS